MPLKINLIQDLQALDQEKARDPMKFIIGGAILIGLIPIAMYGKVYFEKSSAKSSLNQLKSKWKKLEPEYNARLEQEKLQAQFAEKAQSLDIALNAKPLRANVLNVITKIVPPEVELQKLRLIRVNDTTVSVIMTAVWYGDEAQRSIGQAYSKLKSQEFASEGYEIVRESVTEPLVGQITDPQRVSFEMTFNLKVKGQEQ